jgi:hypothetical protein
MLADFPFSLVLLLIGEQLGELPDEQGEHTEIRNREYLVFGLDAILDLGRGQSHRTIDQRRTGHTPNSSVGRLCIFPGQCAVSAPTFKPN